MAEAIVLIGMPASGKSTVGAVLAKRLGWRFTDVDELIEAEQQVAINEIFASSGEQSFRELELAATLKALDLGGIIALGGGAVTNPALRAALAGRNVVWLRSTVQEAVHRVGDSTTRPLLTGDVRGRWQQLAQTREPLYAETASLIVDTDHRNPNQIARAVLAGLGLEEEQ